MLNTPKNLGNILVTQIEQNLSKHRKVYQSFANYFCTI